MINTELLKKVNKNDEWYTLPYAVKPILKFLKTNSNILCPFDTKKSEYVNVLMNAGHNVTYRHIDYGLDFFKLEKRDVLLFDYIISNPPFSKRKQVIEKLFELDKPFAMLMPVVSITLQPIREKIDQCEILIFDKRIKFIAQDGIICKNPPSETAYFCHKILPKQIIFENLGDWKEI